MNQCLNVRVLTVNATYQQIGNFERSHIYLSLELLKFRGNVGLLVFEKFDLVLEVMTLLFEVLPFLVGLVEVLTHPLYLGRTHIWHTKLTV